MLDALVVIVWSFLAQVMVVAVAVGVGVDVAGSDRGLVAVTIVMQLVVLAGTVGWLAIRGVALWRILGPLRPRFRHVWQGVGTGVVGVLVVLVVSAVVASLLPEAPQPEQELLQVVGGDVVTTIGVVLAAVVLAPIQEEITYRSVLFQSTRARVGLPGGLVLSSLVFAGVHLEVWNSPPALISLVVLALWLAAVFHQTGSLVVPVIGHATYNAAMLALSQVMPPDVPGV